MQNVRTHGASIFIMEGKCWSKKLHVWHLFERFSLAHLNVVSAMNNGNAKTHVKHGNWLFKFQQWCTCKNIEEFVNKVNKKVVKNLFTSC